MEEDLFQLSDEEIEERIRELENTYVEFLEGNAHAHDLHLVRERILELQQELDSRKGN